MRQRVFMHGMRLQHVRVREADGTSYRVYIRDDLPPQLELEIQPACEVLERPTRWLHHPAVTTQTEDSRRPRPPRRKGAGAARRQCPRRQAHKPGEAAQSDFTHATALCVTVSGELLVHMLCHLVLPYSNWQSVTVGMSESLLALRRGVQTALFRLGHGPC